VVITHALTPAAATPSHPRHAFNALTVTQLRALSSFLTLDSQTLPRANTPAEHSAAAAASAAKPPLAPLTSAAGTGGAGGLAGAGGGAFFFFGAAAMLLAAAFALPRIYTMVRMGEDIRLPSPYILLLDRPG
jgi:hypothetical protein